MAQRHSFEACCVPVHLAHRRLSFSDASLRFLPSSSSTLRFECLSEAQSSFPQHAISALDTADKSAITNVGFQRLTSPSVCRIEINLLLACNRSAESIGRALSHLPCWKLQPLCVSISASSSHVATLCLAPFWMSAEEASTHREHDNRLLPLTYAQ